MDSPITLTLEGRLFTESGKLLIIDPTDLNNFNNKEMDRVRMEKYRQFMRLDNERYGTLTQSVKALLQYSDRILEELKNDRELIPELKREYEEKRSEYEESCKCIDRRMEELQKSPSFFPPFMAQRRESVQFIIPTGSDGTYPIIQTSEGIQVLFDYPLTSDGEIDQSKLKGDLLGFSSVGSGEQVIIDPLLVRIYENVNPNEYYVAEVGTGAYTCNFIDEKKALSIRRVTDSANN